MKKIFITTGLILLISISKAQSSEAEILAEKIAKKMKDTLSLNDTQKNHVYDINIQLSNEKMSVRQQFTNRDSVIINLQRIENKRDSLYRNVLPGEKYALYLQKKRNLVNNQ